MAANGGVRVYGDDGDDRDNGEQPRNHDGRQTRSGWRWCIRESI